MSATGGEQIMDSARKLIDAANAAAKARRDWMDVKIGAEPEVMFALAQANRNAEALVNDALNNYILLVTDMMKGE